MKLYLITGFLGAGKTTFLKNFIKIFENEQLYIIINEFGKVDVDGALLCEMQATLSRINNGSIFCACRLDKFEETLTQAMTQNPDVILVEASGLSDPTNVRRVLEDKKFSAIQYMGSVCLVDALRFKKVAHTARVCPKQLAVSSLALINKTDLATPDQLKETCDLVRELSLAATLCQTVQGEFSPEWLQLIVPQPDFAPESHSPDITLQKACLSVSPDMTPEQANHLLGLLCEDTYRMKGFLRLGDGNTHLADCVGPMVKLQPHTGQVEQENLGKLVLLAGKGMALRKALKQAVQWYPKLVKIED